MNTHVKYFTSLFFIIFVVTPIIINRYIDFSVRQALYFMFLGMATLHVVDATSRCWARRKVR